MNHGRFMMNLLSIECSVDACRHRPAAARRGKKWKHAKEKNLKHFKTVVFFFKCSCINKKEEAVRQL